MKEEITEGYVGYLPGKILSGIYKITSPSGNFYIGSAVNIAMRWSIHRHQLRKGNHASKQLLDSFRKYGESALIFSVIEFVSNKSKLIEREQFWINKLLPRYNSRPLAASQLGFKHSPESIEKMRVASTGRKWTDSQRERFISKMKGRKRSPETIAKLTGQKRSLEVRARMSVAQMGKKHSLESIAKISATKRAQKRKCFMSDKTKNKISIAMMGNRNGKGAKVGTKQSPELIEKRMAVIRLNKIILLAKFLMLVKPTDEQLEKYAA